MVPKIFENNFIWCVIGIQKILYIYTHLINGNEFDSQKWQEMTKNVWLDFTERQWNDMWAVYKIWLVCVSIRFFWYTDSIHIYWNLQSIWYVNKYMTRNDYFILVCNWYMASGCTYNDLFCCCTGHFQFDMDVEHFIFF